MTISASSVPSPDPLLLLQTATVIILTDVITVAVCKNNKGCYLSSDNIDRCYYWKDNICHNISYETGSSLSKNYNTKVRIVIIHRGVKKINYLGNRNPNCNLSYK